MAHKGPEVNQKLEVRPARPSTGHGDTRARYASRVEAVEESVLKIASPVSGGELVPLAPGQRIVVSFSASDSSYEFEAEILARHREPIPVLVITKPSSVTRVQRREAFRLDVSVPVKYRTVDPAAPEGTAETTERTGRTRDLSEGGALIISDEPDDADSVARGRHLLAAFAIPDDQPPVEARCQVVRSTPQTGGRRAMAVRFVVISQRSKDRIVSYLFRIQRERIRRGIA